MSDKQSHHGPSQPELGPPVSPTQVLIDDVKVKERPDEIGAQPAIPDGSHSSGQGGEDPQGADEQKDGNAVEEARVPKVIPSPVAPTRAQRMEHNITHLPYRSWCSHCAKGRGRADAHRGGQAQEYQKPQLSADYWFMGASGGADDLGETGQEHSPVIVIYEKKLQVAFAHKVPRKGPDPDVVRRLVADLDSIGHKSVVYKSDQENAITSLIRAVRTAWDGDLVIELAPKGDSQANGAAEIAVQVNEGMVRTLKSALESHLKCEIGDDWPIMDWMVEWAAMLIRRHKVGEDGLTAYERLKGKRPTRSLLELGERVLFQEVRSKSEKLHNLEPRFLEGILVGIREIADELIIWNSGGLHRASTVKRRPDEEKWSADEIAAIDCTPLMPHANAAPHRPKVRFDPVVVPEGAPIPERPVIPRRAKLKRTDFADNFGYTQGCPGCDAIRQGRERQPGHSEACRARVEAELSQTDNGRSRLKRAQDNIDSAISGNPDRSEKRAKAESEQVQVAARPEGDRPAAEGENEAKQRRVDPEQVEVEGANSSSSGLAGASSSSSGLATPGSKSTLPSGNIDGPQADIETEDEWGGPGAGGKPPEDVDMSFVTVVNITGGEVNDVSEIYSPPRVTMSARKHRLKAGLSLDITTNDADGVPWDFNNPAMRAKARQLVRETKPRLLIGSPMCTWFSAMMHMNFSRMDPKKVDEAIKNAISHLEFVCSLYKEQVEAGRYFLHEHPQSASSWHLKCVEEILRLPCITTVVGDMCCFGMTCKDVEGNEGPVLKPTRFMTNSAHIAAALGARCAREHYHVQLVGGRAAKAAIYPQKLCDEICKAFGRQLSEDGGLSVSAIEVASDTPIEVSTIAGDDADDEVDVVPVSALRQLPSGEWEAEDDVKGGPLEPEMVMKARVEEMGYVYKHGVYQPAPVERCREETGHDPLETGWLDTNKGDQESPNYRSRFVAKEYKGKQRGARAEMFAATPPAEALRILCSVLATIGVQGTRGDLEMMILDVRRAHFYAKALRKVFIRLPAEDPRAADPKMCGELLRSLYGTQDAAHNWENESATGLVEDGLRRGQASPCQYIDPLTGVRLLVHGDDFVAVGRCGDLDELEGLLRKRYECKVQRLGWRKGRSRQARVLGRIITLHEDGVDIEADPALIETAIRAYGVEDGNAVTTPAAKSEAIEESSAPQSQASGDADSSVSSLGAMLQAAWKSGDKGSGGGEPLAAGQVRGFKVTKLDPSQKSIELTLA